MLNVNQGDLLPQIQQVSGPQGIALSILHLEAHYQVQFQP